MSVIEVVCAADGTDWLCSVRVVEADGASTHEVRVRPDDVPDGSGPRQDGVDGIERLVNETFVFMLEREPRGSILVRFDLGVVARYFPEYPHEIRRRLARPG